MLVAVRRGHLGQHGLAGAWGTEEEEAAHGVTEHPAVPQGGEDVGEDHGEGDAVVQGLFGLGGGCVKFYTCYYTRVSLLVLFSN